MNNNFSITTLGCKVNQAESSSLAERLLAQGWQETAGGTAFLFTCTVTANAARQSRQMARRLARAHEKVVVSGCDVQVNPEKYADFVLLPRARLTGLEYQQAGAVWPAPDSGPWVPGVRKPSPRHTRGQLKVQDGCDANCAYCIVPTARGKPRSLSLLKACAAFISQGRAGAREVVLSGIHLGRYQNGPYAHSLTLLLESLLKVHARPRLRLSSLEANEISDELLAMMAENRRICPHLHIPLQSGSDQVLQAMGRPYSAALFAGKVEAAAARVPDICIGADVLVGLPGETEAEFRKTFELLRQLPVHYMHVFPYSPRMGTRAALMPTRAPVDEVKERALAIRQLGREKWRQFLESQKNGIRMVLAESNRSGRAENYCPVRMPAGTVVGGMYRLRITGLGGNEKQPQLNAVRE